LTRQEEKNKGMANFKLTLLAQEDLRTIHDYIAINNPKAATHYIRVLKEKWLFGILHEIPKN
jgi:hypothetical protein